MTPTSPAVPEENYFSRAQGAPAVKGGRDEKVSGQGRAKSWDCLWTLSPPSSGNNICLVLRGAWGLTRIWPPCGQLMGASVREEAVLSLKSWAKLGLLAASTWVCLFANS